MNHNKYLPMLGFALALSMSVPVHGGLLSMDDTKFGEGAITFDTDTKLEWLDLSFAINRSVDDIKSELISGGLFEGFRYATGVEIAQMFGNAGLPFNVTTSNELFIQNVEELVDFVGETSRESGFSEVHGVSAESITTPSSRVLGAGFFYDISGKETYEFGSLYTIDNDAASEKVSHWLVKNALQISAPSSGVLLLVGGLALRRIRKHS